MKPSRYSQKKAHREKDNHYKGPPIEVLLIGELARRSGTSSKTIRFYEEIGLIPSAPRGENGYRYYTSEDVERLRFIRSARTLGFSIDDLREILALRAQGKAPCRHVSALLTNKVTEVEAHIQQLRELQEDLQELLLGAETLPNNDIEMKQCVCNLIRVHPY